MVKKDLKVIRAKIESSYADAGQAVPLTAKGSTSTSREVLENASDPDLVLLASISNDEKLFNYLCFLCLSRAKHVL